VPIQLGHSLAVNQNCLYAGSILKRKQAVNALEAALPLGGQHRRLPASNLNTLVPW
jgi:hypothetical protein